MAPIPGVVIQVVIGGSVSVMPSQVDTTGSLFSNITSESNPAAVSVTGFSPPSLTFAGNGPVGQSSVIGYQLQNGNTGSFTVEVIAAAPTLPSHFFTTLFLGDPLVITPADVGQTSNFVSFSNESNPNATLVISLNPNLTIAGLLASQDNDITYQLANGTQGVLRVTVVDTNDTFTDFLESTVEPLLLIEIDYDSGTVYLASRPWLAPDTHQPYDDWIINEPSLDASLRNFLTVGEVDAINPENGFFANNWLSHDWHGYDCRWYLGAEDWDRSEFRLIVTAQVDECRLLDGGETYRFTLQDPAKRYETRWLTAAKTYNNTAPNIINSILTEAGFQPPQYLGIDFSAGAEGQYQCTVDADETTDMLDTLKKLASSMGAYVRAYSGWLQIIRPDRREFGTAAPIHELDESDIAMDGFRSSSVQQGNQTVDIVLSDGTIISSTGDNGTRRVDTFINNLTDAGNLLSDLSLYYNRKHHIIEIRSRSGVFYSSVGDVIAHQYPEVNVITTQRMGIIERVRISPLSQWSTIDLAHSAFN